MQQSTPWRRDATYTPRGVQKSPFKNRTESKQLYASCHKGRSIVRYNPTELVLLLFEEGLSRQVLEESVLPRLEVGCVGYPYQSHQSPTNCPSSSTRT